MEEYIAVIGGLNMDIAGISGADYRERDSNLGQIQMSPGGVGRNISHNLVNLGIPTFLITMYGNDEFGRSLEQSCKELNIRVDHAEKLRNGRTSTYMYITDAQGDMIAAVNDMDIINDLTPEVLETKMDVLNKAKLCILDANLPKETIEWICANIKVPIFADPVSVAKANKFSGVLDKLDTIKPNQMEAELYTSIKIIDDETAKTAVEKLIHLGVKNVYITLGENGIVCGNEEGINFVPNISSPILSTNGAGDASIAAIAWSRMQYDQMISIEEIAQIAQAAASITIGDLKSVSNSLSAENLQKVRDGFYVDK